MEVFVYCIFVIVMDVGGVNELVINEIIGWLVSVNDVVLLVMAMEDCLIL